MSNLKAVLLDGSEIELEEFALPMKLVVLCDTRSQMFSVWDALSGENASSISIHDDGELQQSFSNVYITGVQSVINSDGTMTVHFYMHGESVANTEDSEEE